MSRSTYYFATRQDILAGSESFENGIGVQYIQTGLFESAEFRAFSSVDQIATVGKSDTGSSSSDLSFLVMLADQAVRVRDVQQRKGGVLYAIDQLANSKSISVRYGGVYEDQYVIRGEVGTVSDDPQSLELYKTFVSSISKQFSSFNGYRIGPEAMRLHKSGMRLTHASGTDRKYDFVLEES